MKAVVLDLFGTLFPLEPLGKHLEAAGVSASALKLWFARILRDAWALEVAGQYRPFREVAGGALEVLMVEQGRHAGAEEDGPSARRLRHVAALSGRETFPGPAASAGHQAREPGERKQAGGGQAVRERGPVESRRAAAFHRRREALEAAAELVEQ